MQVRSLQQRFAQLFSSYNVKEKGPFTCEQAAKFVRESRHVRAHDYVFSFDVDGTVQEQTVTTVPQWFFILTNAAVYFDRTSGQVFPDVSITFPDAVGSTPFGTSREAAGNVPSKLVFATEGAGRFEEYKNIFYVLGERVNITAKVVPPAGYKFHGSILLSGVEIDLTEAY